MNKMVDAGDTRNVALHEFFQFRCSPQWVAATVGMGAATSAAIALSLRWRRFRLPIAAVVSAAGVAGVSYTIMLEPRRPVLERVTLRLPSLPPTLRGVRIGHLSDFHLGFPFVRSNVQWAVEQMRAEQPDLVVITGDFVSFKRAIPTLPDLLNGLHAPLGVYAVPGNHDHWEGLENIRTHLEPLGISFLMNRSTCLHWQGTPFWLAGIDDVWYGSPDLEAALHHVPPEGFTILLSHVPDFADDAARHPVALQLSGHTHGGHLQLPGLGWFCVPFYGLRYISGLFRIGTMHLYVSRGLGGVPLRLNCRPEATVLTLETGEATTVRDG